jgi:Rieske Fe-S protein
MAAVRLTPANGVVRVPLGQHPELARPGGFIRVQVEGLSESLYLLALADGGYAALSPICTHLGCTVDVQGAQLVCPCHGSTYDRSGSVLRGPAERPLRRFPVAVSPDENLTIQLQ